MTALIIMLILIPLSLFTVAITAIITLTFSKRRNAAKKEKAVKLEAGLKEEIVTRDQLLTNQVDTNDTMDEL